MWYFTLTCPNLSKALRAFLVAYYLQLNGFWVPVGEASAEASVELNNSPKGQNLKTKGRREALLREVEKLVGIKGELV